MLMMREIQLPGCSNYAKYRVVGACSPHDLVGYALHQHFFRALYDLLVHRCLQFDPSGQLLQFETVPSTCSCFNHVHEERVYKLGCTYHSIQPLFSARHKSTWRHLGHLVRLAFFCRITILISNCIPGSTAFGNSEGEIASLSSTLITR